MTKPYNTTNLLKKCSAALTSMTGHFSTSAFSDAPVLDTAFRAEVEQLCRDMDAHCAKLEKAGVEAVKQPKHPTKAEGRAPRGATGSLKRKKTQGRKKLPTTAEVLAQRPPRTTGGVPVEDEDETVKLPTGGAIPLTEDEKRRAKAVLDAKNNNQFF